LLPGEAPPPEAIQPAQCEEAALIEVPEIEEPDDDVVEVLVQEDAPVSVAEVEIPEPEEVASPEPEEDAPVRRRRRRSSATTNE